MTLKSISQKKQIESGTAVTQISTEDLKLVIKSNEVGKRAIKKLPLLQEKINVLDSSLTLTNARLKLRNETIDSLYATAQANESKYKQVIANDKKISESYNESIKILNSELSNAKLSLKKARARNWLFGAGAVLISSLILLIK